MNWLTPTPLMRTKTVNQLLLVSLGPIQDFIASARKCQDLWFGSWMLSDVARAAAQAIEDAAGEGALIFPGNLHQQTDRDPAVANKILAIVPQGKDPAQVAQAGQDAMRHEITHLADDAFKRFDNNDPYFNRELADVQLRHMMEYLWVAVKMHNGDYRACRDRAEKLLAQRKSTRTWGAVEWSHMAGVGVPKSSLDGQRESVLHENLYDKLRTHKRKNQHAKAHQRRQQYFINSTERLCGVGMLKRVGVALTQHDQTTFGGHRKPAFHSTSHLAAAPILTRINAIGTNAQETLDDLIRTFEDHHIDLDRLCIRSGASPQASPTDLLDAQAFEPTSNPVNRTFAQYNDGRGFDGQLLFASRVESIVEEASRTDHPTPPDVVTHLQKAVQGTLNTLKLASGPTPYYAIIMADGDRMGSAIDAVGDIERHREIGKALEDFTGQCEQLVTKASGSLIYAGGDDVLAMVPLHTALQCAWALREAFREAIEPQFKDLDALKQHHPDLNMPTLSVGMAIVHHMERMDRAHELARQAERMAKDAGRNALAILVDKRSGPTLKAVGQWDQDDTPLHQRLARWAKWIQDKEIPSTLPHLMAEAIRVWQVPTPVASAPSTQHAQDEAIRAIVQRVVKRRRESGGTQEISPLVRQALTQALNTDNHGDILTLAEQLSQELRIAKLFLAARNDAFGHTQEEVDP